jgi:hypothetical protein
MPIQFEKCPECKQEMKPELADKNTKEAKGNKYLMTIEIRWYCDKETRMGYRSNTYVDKHLVEFTRTYGITKEIGQIET